MAHQETQGPRGHALNLARAAKMPLDIIVYQPPRQLRVCGKIRHENEVEDARTVLPEDLVPLMCSLLNARELGVVALLNKYWNSAAERDEYWERLCVECFHVRSSSLHPPPSPVKRLFEFHLIALQHCLEGLRGPAQLPQLPVIRGRN